jgi:hypothetical protein
MHKHIVGHEEKSVEKCPSEEYTPIDLLAAFV